MSTRLRDVIFRELGELRYEPTDKRIRAVLGGETVVDSTRAVLVWEPKRVVPTYAVPLEDLRADLAPAPDDVAADGPAGIPAIGAPMLGEHAVLDPSIPFAVHTADGEPLRITSRDSGRTAAGFRPLDETLAGHVVLDFDGFDAWYEEDERNYAHPRDPFHRVDVVHGSRHVRVESGGQVLAESSRPLVLFEPPLPVRYYLRPEDVRMDLLRPSEKVTYCAYKGEAHYASAEAEDDVAWTYPAPLREAAEVTGRYAFFNERVDIVVDGARLDRPLTPWSPRRAS
jgi:uncharacterized protein (DUF427 family)